MKVLSLRQPWADLVVSGTKRVETRGWTTTYRGPLYIHASGRPSPKQTLPVRVIIGRVDLIEVVPVESLRVSDRERSMGDYSRGRYGWILRNPVRLARPIPALGKLGLWEFTRP